MTADRKKSLDYNLQGLGSVCRSECGVKKGKLLLGQFDAFAVPFTRTGQPEPASRKLNANVNATPTTHTKRCRTISPKDISKIHQLFGSAVLGGIALC